MIRRVTLQLEFDTEAEMHGIELCTRSINIAIRAIQKLGTDANLGRVTVREFSPVVVYEGLMNSNADWLETINNKR